MGDYPCTTCEGVALVETSDSADGVPYVIRCPDCDGEGWVEYPKLPREFWAPFINADQEC